MAELVELGKRAREAARILNSLDTAAKQRGLRASADALVSEADRILEANAPDVEAARKRGVSAPLVDRLTLTKERIAAMAEGLRQVAELPDPIGAVMDHDVRPNGLQIEKVRAPFGVIGIIYESRPNVTADAFALTFMSGNAVILRGGSDAIGSNMAIVEVIRKALKSQDLPEDALQLVEDTSRETVREFMKLRGYLDLLIPRGGAGLIRSVVENAEVPVIETGVGNCHIYVDESADLRMALDIIDNAKTQRMGVCNAAESLVVHKGIAPEAVPLIRERLKAKEIEMRGDEASIALSEGILKASEEDFATEFLGPVLSIKVVDSLDEAIAHINHYSTGHSEAIITENKENAERFLREIDSACVYVNASTRFSDGFEFGFGAEIGISTQKFHARGPMGLEALTTYKYEIRGTGQVRG
ncbi:MAG: glutamate-5-semialdehyde dehydrogenase [Lachnospiraceae bacterium]|nr:glutamate-5-semialdehyde dehydrogenase [Lachnospiraceae bacterium]